jgi:Zn-dependent peptidase ImmA (M78 family)
VQAVSQYEKGKHAPTQDILRRIADKLNLPFHFFLRPLPPAKTKTKFYRSMSTATKGARTKAERRYEWWCEIVSYVCNFVKLPKVNFPSVEVPVDPREITSEFIEEVARGVRRHWQLGDGPISNVAWLIENNGAMIARHRLDAEKLDAFSEWRDDAGRPFIVLGTDKGSAVRSRFDVVHELAHMILHRNLALEDFSKGDIFNVIEEQADRFAGAFLLPESTFSEDAYAPTLDGFSALKSKWKVSIGAMIARARQLELIDDDQERKLWINRTRRGWRTNEPLDDTIEPETSRFLRRSVELLIDKKIVSRQDIPFQLGLTAKDVEELAGLTPGYLSDQTDEMRPLLKFPSDAPDNDESETLKFGEHRSAKI